MSITQKTLQLMKQELIKDKTAIIAMNSVTKNGIHNSALNVEAVKNDIHEYSISLKTGNVTEQKQSGRCWMFAALNTMRYGMIKELKLENFEFSQTYPLFFDKLEKANSFLENILNTLDEPTTGRLVSFLLAAPMNDGGQFDMFAGLVEKYGLVPKDAMPETASSSNTREMDKYLTLRLREFACILRQANEQGKSRESLLARREEMLKDIYRILVISLGFPPDKVDFLARDKDGKLYREDNLTPQEFYQKYVGWNLKDSISLINAPTKDKPFHKAYTVRFLSSVTEARPVRYLNLPAQELKQAAVRQLQAGEPVWFGCDVGQFSARDGGLMDLEALAVDELLGVDFLMNKAQRLDYGESLMTHAMVLMGVHLDAQGKPVRWRVENSWGKDAGKDGFFLMTDDWFSEYTYQVVINRKHLSSELLKEYDDELIVLEPWDPMGSLAGYRISASVRNSSAIA